MINIFEGMLENSRLNIQFLIDGKTDGWIDLFAHEFNFTLGGNKGLMLRLKPHKSLCVSYHTSNISLFITADELDNCIYIQDSFLIMDESFKLKDIISTVEYIGPDSENVKKYMNIYWHRKL